MFKEWIDRMFRDEEEAPAPTLVECLRELYDIQPAIRHEPAPRNVNTDIYQTGGRDKTIPHRTHLRRRRNAA